MADRDLALHAGRDGSVGDLAKLRGACLAPIVQVNVDCLAESLGESEDDIELAANVAVESCGVQSANKVSARLKGSRKQVRRAAFGDNAALRKRDELNVDPVAVGLADLQDGFEIGETDVIVDVDMASRTRCAVRDKRANERRGTGFDRQRNPMARDSLGGNSLAHAASFDMRQARRAPVRLIKMNMALDEGGQEEPPGKIDAAVAGRCGARRPHRDNKAIGDLDVGETAARQARIGENDQMRLSRRAATYL